jgi:hypothetical protein
MIARREEAAERTEVSVREKRQGRREIRRETVREGEEMVREIEIETEIEIELNGTESMTGIERAMNTIRNERIIMITTMMRETQIIQTVAARVITKIARIRITLMITKIANQAAIKIGVTVRAAESPLLMMETIIAVIIMTIKEVTITTARVAAATITTTAVVIKATAVVAPGL